ncbi:MAG TPA: peptidoglycan DD-metalloendopeptidase family protein [Geminicoccaceae bacterium]|nr:peptidoglycan DD-metalloendopeptidase family protein [Geminicoccaceae bacterium]
MAFAIGFGAGVVGAFVMGQPGEPGAGRASAAVGPADDAVLAHARESLPTATPALGAESRVPAGPAVSKALQAGTHPPAVAAAMLAGLPHGLSREAELAGQARLAKAVLSERAWFTEQITVRRGDTLMDILGRAGIAPSEAHAAVRSLLTVYDPRRLRAGQELLIRAAQQPAEVGARRLIGLDFDLDFDHTVRVSRGADGSYATAKVARPQRRDLVHRAGIIDDSLYLSAERAAVPQDVTISLIKLFSWDVDFQRDVRQGDRFEALFETVALEDGSDIVRGGDLLYAALSIDGRLFEGYRFELPDGGVAYFDRSGKSLRKFLMRTPIDGARLSSRFGMRRHPILGYNRMHQGVDFAAPTGTPIYAAGEGKVEIAKRNGGYGKYIRIRHTGEYSTAYAHLSRFAKGIAPGRRVRQGEVIGYVGTTGRSTGPHLHYEVLRRGAQINPLQIKQAANQQLAGADLERFGAEIARIDRLREDPPPATRVASHAP